MSEPKVSQHILDKRRSNRRQIAWSVTLTVIIVLAMTYYDLAIRDYAPRNQPEVQYHYVGSDSDLAGVPNDSTTLTIWQGVLTPLADGTVTLAGTPVTPVNIAQRQIDLYFGLADLPADAQGALVKTLGDQIKKWEGQNSLVMDALIDTSALDGVPPARLQSFIERLHSTYPIEYRYTLVFDALDENDLLVKMDKDARKELLKQTHAVAIRVTPENAAKAIAAADTLGVRFSVIVPPGTNVTNFESDAAAKAKYFTHFIRDAAPVAQ